MARSVGYSGTSAYKRHDYEDYSMQQFKSRSVREVKRKRSSAAQVSAATPKAKTNAAKKKSLHSRKSSVRVISSVMVMLAVAFLILYRYSVIVEQNEQISDLKSQYEELADANKRLQVTIDSSLNLANIEEIAINRLGMRKPEKYQTVYINVTGDDYAEVTSSPQASNSRANQFYATIIQTLGNVLEYLY